MRNHGRHGLMGLLAAALLVFATGCASTGSHSLGYSAGPGGAGCGHRFRAPRYGYRGYGRGRYHGRRHYRRRPGMHVGFYLD